MKITHSLFVFFNLQKPTDNKTLIAILASCGALLIMIFILAICASHHRKSYNENQVSARSQVVVFQDSSTYNRAGETILKSSVDYKIIPHHMISQRSDNDVMQ